MGESEKDFFVHLILILLVILFSRPEDRICTRPLREGWGEAGEAGGVEGELGGEGGKGSGYEGSWGGKGRRGESGRGGSGKGRRG